MSHVEILTDKMKGLEEPHFVDLYFGGKQVDKKRLLKPNSSL